MIINSLKKSFFFSFTCFFKLQPHVIVIKPTYWDNISQEGSLILISILSIIRGGGCAWASEKKLRINTVNIKMWKWDRLKEKYCSPYFLYRCECFIEGVDSVLYRVTCGLYCKSCLANKRHKHRLSSIISKLLPSND